jgi:hypothetical protein
MVGRASRAAFSTTSVAVTGMGPVDAPINLSLKVPDRALAEVMVMRCSSGSRASLACSRMGNTSPATPPTRPVPVEVELPACTTSSATCKFRSIRDGGTGAPQSSINIPKGL